MASRPQESGDGNEAKWADIDDDEDDWAPETIEWNDGTKINLAQMDNAGAAELQPTTTKEKRSDGVAEIMRPKPPATKLTTVGPNATVLKLGSASQPRSPSTMLKNSSEKPTLVAKPSTSTPVKSPWAPIPPVDKASPVPINPPAQQAQSRFGQKDPHGFDAMPPPPTPHAKEIAADDFSRSSRDSASTIPRELFNSQSGRYEPVGETRRQSMRKDPNFRQPSVLQRPPPGDQHGPAEPSPAFQTHRSQQESGSFARRRTSSTVSGESGRLGRRVSFSRGLDGSRTTGEILRRDSQHDQLPATPSLASSKLSQRDASPAFSQGQSVNSQSPTVASTQIVTSNGPQQQKAPNDTPVSPAVVEEDPIVAQKRTMREKREAAIKRRKEEEEREETERKERIRLKMEKLGLTDEKMGKKATVTDPTPSPKIILKDSREQQQPIPQSPPKPPIPNTSGQPQQYGLMKVHGPQPVNTVSPSHVVEEKKFTEPPHVIEAKPDLHNEEPTLLVNGDSRKSPQEVNQSLEVDALHKEIIVDPRSQPWSSVQQASGAYPNWNNSSIIATHPSPPGNLWGPPSNHRALGNGDFHNNIPRTSLRQAQPPYSQQLVSTPQPQPIGTPRQNQQLRAGTSPDKPFDSTPRSIVEDSQTIPAFPPETNLSSANYTRPQVSNPTPSFDLNHAPIPTTSTNAMTPPISVERPSALNAWASFGANAAKADVERHTRVLQEHAARMAEQQLATGKAPPQYSTLKETWKQVKRNDTGGPRKVVGNMDTEREFQDSAEVPKPPIQIGTAPHIRSRYQDIFDQSQRAVSAPLPIVRPVSPTGPPPESLDHPAYESASQRPLVNLPGSKRKADFPEKPVVRLPPAKTSHVSFQASATLQPHIVVSPTRGTSQPLTSSSSWQDRINGLFDRKVSPEKKFADVANFSASKVPLEHLLVSPSTLVTLPPQDQPDLVATELSIKCVEDEDALFEERDFGSVPITRIPARIPIPAWNPAHEPHVPFKIAKAMVLGDPDVLSAFPFVPGYDETIRRNGIPVTISLQGMTARKTKVMPQPSSFVPPRAGQPYYGKGKPRNTHKNRESGSPHGSSNTNNKAASSTGPPKPRNKHNNTSSWARRVSSTA